MKGPVRLLALLLALSFWAADIPQAWAKCWTVSGHTFCDNREAAGKRGGGGSGTTSTAPTGPSPEQIRQDRERQRLRAKTWYSEEAMDYVDRKDWDNAIRSFEEALDRDPDDPELNALLKRAKAEKEKSRRPAVVVPQRPAPDNDSRVVDARGAPQAGADLLAKVPELQKSPEAERIRKGYQALLNRDWQVTLAWWQEALSLDPGNAALKRSVELAKWMVDRQKEVRPGAVTLFSAANAAAERGDFDSALELLQQLKTSNPAMAAPAERMAEEVRTRRASGRVPQMSDLEYLFPSPYAAAIAATTKADYAGAIDLLGQVKRTHPDLARTTDAMISNVKLLALPVQLPDPEDAKLLFPERAYAGPMSGSGLELLADGYGKKAQQIFDRVKLAALPRKAR